MRLLTIEVPWLTHDIGLGDIIKQVTSLMGIHPTSDCGCNRRANKLNALVVFTGSTNNT